jgi:hypothetical protein
LLLAASLCTVGSAANACVEFREYQETAFLAADLIFVGELTDYEVVTIADSSISRETAVLTYKVDEVLKGKAGKTIRLWWPNSTFEYPSAIPRFSPTVVAAEPSERSATDASDGFRYPSKASITSLPVVHQVGCSPASIFPAGSSDIETIKRWIAAGAADGTRLNFNEDYANGDELPARHSFQWNLLPLAAGLVAVGILLTVIWWRRPQRSKPKA